jgi:hypothetical protein
MPTLASAGNDADHARPWCRMATMSALRIGLAEVQAGFMDALAEA